MTKITESAIELLALKRLEDLGYHYLYGPDIAPDASTGSATGVASKDNRDSYEQVLLLNRLKSAVQKINPNIPTEAQNEAIKALQRIASPELLANNETFHRLLTEGIPVTKRMQGDDRGDRVWLIDFNHPHHNEFLVVNQFTIVANNQNKRPTRRLFPICLPTMASTLFRMGWKQSQAPCLPDSAVLWPGRQPTEEQKPRTWSVSWRR
jgi:type I restriction enzyme R subunit